MAESIPDPYIALGIARNADAATIKAQYRRLALKFHPDKVQDESQKELAADQFHRIQSAYEIVGDERRRQKYDAECHLLELRKNRIEREGSRSDGNMGGFQVPSPRGGEFYARGPERSDRMPSSFEERRPSYAATPEFFDAPPRATSRKEPDYERSTKRSPPRSEREKVKAYTKESKENERSSRKEKSRRTDRDIRRDRDRKQTVYPSVEDPSSDSDQQERVRRMMREEEEARRAYHEQARRQKEEAANGYYADDRARKLFAQQDGARDYIDRSTRSSRPRTESERRPSPVRMNSSKEKPEYVKRNDGRPSVMFRRGSGRPRTTGNDAEPRRTSPRIREPEIVDEPQETFKPPPFVSSKSSPVDIRMPSNSLRSRSGQLDVDYEPPIPQIRRSETMPTEIRSSTRDGPRRRNSAAPTKNPGPHGELQQGYPTPEPSPEPPSRKYHYGQEYADDAEVATPEGYRTADVREPTSAARSSRYTRSPSPIREPMRERAKERANSNAIPTVTPRPPQAPRTTSTTYVYGDSRADSYARPTPSRENSGRSPLLYREVPTASTARSPRTSSSSKFPPAVPEDVPYQREVRAEDIKVQTGYSTGSYSSRRRHASESKPSYNRSGSSSSPIYVR